MKLRRLAAALIAATLLLCALPVLAEEAEPSFLTFERAVQVNDHQIVAEFSEPVGININQANGGPFCAVRIVGDNNTLLQLDSVWQQFTGAIEYADSKHDRIVFTLYNTRYNLDTLDKVWDYKNSQWSDKDITLCFEEVPYNSAIPSGNGYLDNITTADGSKNLWANRPIGADGAYCKIEVDYNYNIDLSHTESVYNTMNLTGAVLGDGSQEEEAPKEIQRIVKNDTLTTVLIIAGGVVASAVLLLGLMLILRAARKGKKGGSVE